MNKMYRVRNHRILLRQLLVPYIFLFLSKYIYSYTNIKGYYPLTSHVAQNFNFGNSSSKSNSNSNTPKIPLGVPTLWPIKQYFD